VRRIDHAGLHRARATLGLVNAPEQAAKPSDDWSDLSEEERVELRRAFAEADEEYRRGEGIPREEVLPRLRRAG
jgi:hypothetical protein